MASSADGAVEKPCVITQGLPSYTETVGPPASIKTNTKRWLIVAISVAVVVAMVTGATLFGVYMQNSHVRSLVQEMTVNTKNGKERIRADPEKAEEEYELPDKKFRVLHDFNKGISVFRVALEKKLACYVLPLNQTGMMTPDALASYLKRGGELDEEDNGNYPFDLVASETKVKDITFLSDSARAMCNGLSVYWLMPAGQDLPESEEKTGGNTGRRQKRLAKGCRRRVCEKYCYCMYVFKRGRLCCVRRCSRLCYISYPCGCCG